MMELKDFVRETIVSIVTGVKEAQDAVTGTGARINPVGLRYCGMGSSLLLAHAISR